MRLNLEQLRKQAKELRASGAQPTLAEAQRALAREHGYASWARLKRALELQELRRLIEEGDAARAAALLSSSPALVKSTFDDGSTPLHVAAGENRPELVEVLVRYGASPQAAFGKSAHSALSWALTCWSYPAAEKLVELGVVPDLFCAGEMMAGNVLGQGYLAGIGMTIGTVFGRIAGAGAAAAARDGA